MNNFETLVKATMEAGNQSETYLNSFLTAKNLKNYEIPEEADTQERKAIQVMFRSKKNLRDRLQKAFDYDPLCLEAFFVYYILSEDIFVNYRFEAYLKQASEYADFNAYQKRCYIRIMNFYVEFLLDIHHMSGALRVQKLIIRLANKTDHIAVSRLSFIYSTLEDDVSLYRLYLDEEFDIFDYLLLLITLLKHEERFKAEEVLADMFKNIEYSTYLDHLWDLDMNDQKQKDFYQAVEDCYDDIRAIPYFFSWVNEIKEKFI